MSFSKWHNADYNKIRNYDSIFFKVKNLSKKNKNIKFNYLKINIFDDNFQRM